MAQLRPAWKAWGDHPVYVILAAIGTIVSIFVAIRPITGQTPSPQARGVVSDIKTRKPIATAKVTFRFKDFLRTVYTDNEGVYKLPLRSDADGQEGHITVEKEGYDVYTRHIMIDRIFEDILLAPNQDRRTGGEVSPPATTANRGNYSIEKGYASSNATERAEAIRAAFEAVSVFGVVLEADWSLVDERDKKRYATELPRCEQIISRPINFYSRETGKFGESKDFSYGTFQGQVSGQSIRFGGIGYGGVSYSGNLVNTGNDWKFTGLVTCGSYRYKAVFQLR